MRFDLCDCVCVCVIKTGDGPEKTGLWPSLYGMLVTHAGISVQQSEPALKLWAVFPLGEFRRVCVFKENTERFCVCVCVFYM